MPSWADIMPMRMRQGAWAMGEAMEMTTSTHIMPMNRQAYMESPFLRPSFLHSTSAMPT